MLFAAWHFLWLSQTFQRYFIPGLAAPFFPLRSNSYLTLGTSMSSKRSSARRMSSIASASIVIFSAPTSTLVISTIFDISLFSFLVLAYCQICFVQDRHGMARTDKAALAHSREKFSAKRFEKFSGLAGHQRQPVYHAQYSRWHKAGTRRTYVKGGAQRLREAGADTIETLSRSSFGRSGCGRDKVKYEFDRKERTASPGTLVRRKVCESQRKVRKWARCRETRCHHTAGGIKD